MTVKPAPVHAFDSLDSLGLHDAVALRDLLERGEVQSTELIESAFRRLEKVEPALQATVCLQKEVALENARQFDQAGHHGGFGGVPCFLKDNLDLEGLPTRFGSEAIPPKPRPRHSAIARQFMNSGLVLLGKSRTPEFGLTATTEYSRAGAAHNPWDIRHSTGGSSGGSAALVAAGVVPIAHANDGGGSIRIPAACCGLVGLKPSRGRLVANEMARGLPINIVSDGVLTRSVRDTAAFFAHAEQHYRSPSLPALGHIQHPGKKRLRIGMFTTRITGENAHPDCVEAVHRTARLCEELGHEIQEIAIPFPPRFADDFLLYWSMLAASVSGLGRVLVDRQFKAERLEPLTFGLARHFRKNLLKFPMALRRLWSFGAEYEMAFEKLDVVLSPTLGHPAPVLGHLALDLPFEEARERLTHFAAFTAAQNVSGAPAISLPMHQSAAGLPVGVQFAAATGQEARLIELALELEGSQPFKTLA